MGLGTCAQRHGKKEGERRPQDTGVRPERGTRVPTTGGRIRKASANFHGSVPMQAAAVPPPTLRRRSSGTWPRCAPASNHAAALRYLPCSHAFRLATRQSHQRRKFQPRGALRRVTKWTTEAYGHRVWVSDGVAEEFPTTCRPPRSRLSWPTVSTRSALLATS